MTDQDQHWYPCHCGAEHDVPYCPFEGTMPTPEQAVTLEQEVQHAISNGPAAITPDLLQRAMHEIAALRAELKQIGDAVFTASGMGSNDLVSDVTALIRVLRSTQAELQQTTGLLSQAEASATYFDQKSLRLEAALRDLLAQQQQVVEEWKNRSALELEFELDELDAGQALRHKIARLLFKEVSDQLAALIDRSRQGAEAPKEPHR